MTDTEIIETLLDQLRRMAVGDVAQRCYGICSNVSRAFEPKVHQQEVMPLLRRAYRVWPKWSGDLDYPVPHPSLGCMGAYANTLDLWAGEYGETRMELVHFLIAHFEAVLPGPMLARDRLWLQYKEQGLTTLEANRAVLNTTVNVSHVLAQRTDIMGAFSWRHTPEGSAYWRAIARRTNLL